MTTQINQLTELTTTSDGDLLLIRESATGVDKKMQAQNLRAKATTKDDVGLGNVPNLDTTDAVAGNFSSVDIDGGNIDGTAIGASSASSGEFTTLDASDDVNFDSGTLFVDASANRVGIGTTSPSNKLTVNGYIQSEAVDDWSVIRATPTSSARSAVSIYDPFGTVSSSNPQWFIGQRFGSHGPLQIWKYNGSSHESSALVIDSSGNVLIGTTSTRHPSTLHETRGAANSTGEALFAVYNTGSNSAAPSLNLLKADATTSSSQRFVQFYANGISTPMGGIVGNGASNVQFASISDAREKTNIVGINGSLKKINALKPVAFDWISNKEHCPAGFVAQDVEQVFPEFVIENFASEGQEPRKGLTGGMTGGIVAHLVKAIQELTAEVEQLKAQLGA